MIYEELMKELHTYFDEDGDMLLIEPAYTLARFILDQVPNATENIMQEYSDLFYDLEYNGHYAIIGVAIVLVRLGRNRTQIRERALMILNKDLETECKESLFTIEQTKELIKLISNYKDYKYDFKLPKKVLPKVNRLNFPYDKGDTFFLKLDDPEIGDIPYYNQWVIFSVVSVKVDGRMHLPTIVFYNWCSNEPELNFPFESLKALTLTRKGGRPLIKIILNDNYNLFDGDTCLYVNTYTLSNEVNELVYNWTFHDSPNKDIHAEIYSDKFIKQCLKLVYNEATRQKIPTYIDGKLVV